MKKNKKQFPLYLLVMALVGMTLLVFSTVKQTTAVLNIESGDYDSKLEMKEMSLALVDKDGKDPSKIEVEDFNIGVDNKISVAVKNDGKIDEYVRVVVYKYWEKDGSKDPAKDASLISLVVSSALWKEDTDAATDERQIFYYTKPLEVGEVSEELLSAFTVDGKVKNNMSVTVDEEKGVVTVSYDYNGYSAVLDIEADGVQTHNYDKAARSAWGVDLDSKIN